MAAENNRFHQLIRAGTGQEKWQKLHDHGSRTCASGLKELEKSDVAH
jgi:hypothetical protein